MAGPVSATVIKVGHRRRHRLEKIVNRPSSPQVMVVRARIVLLVADGWPLARIAATLRVTETTVRKWRDRFAERGIRGLLDLPRPGRPELYGPEVRLRVIACATSAPPAGQAAWTHTLIAERLADTGISLASVGRILTEADLRPHKVRGWLNRLDDEQFWHLAAAVCDLYLRPPDDGVLVSVDEKTGIQAKSRKYPELAAEPGRAARREFEYVRHGTVSILAAMNVLSGEVLAEQIDRNDSATFIAFLTMLDQMIDPRLNIYLIMDNGASHTSRATRAWLAAHPRFKVTYTPKHASWLNVIEMWFSVLTRRLLRRGEFTSRQDLMTQIEEFTIRHNTTARPYRWRYDARTEHARYLSRRDRERAQAPALEDAA
ncbi:IS630 family transposase [Sphaerimonospora thailandensis]|uniref:IS630 family transposase n=1 Tax=Sphaerimonospora thailandensis TaxID=795644 RepID=A0A8J3RF44_9ACTN|nr:IS630 family transposase [Sphaerimonospora thailandensis]GIH73560.1 IS630 family transposase [Sphaerimonospora thailandensis]